MTANFFNAIGQQIHTAFTAEKKRGQKEKTFQLRTGASSDLQVRDDEGLVIGMRTQLRVTATRAKGTSHCPLHDDAFIHTAIVREVNRLPECHRALVMHCHGGQPSEWDHIQTVCAYIWSRLQLFIEGWERFRERPLKPEKVQKLKALVFTALQQYRESTVNNRRLYTVSVLAGLLGISDANWRRDWGPFFNQMMVYLAELDRQGLMIVATGTKTKKTA